ncbi:MAG: Fic family protein [Fimbriimonas ginsengisoli]|uniref:Fic family protein n=1 Tax=Fimbriimonas ginsengisoli TaxID=1005039 RepID=A0A931PXB1_FIMGI|nr:Fic family protein [Fimbriimonas ginsengisoli]
MAALRYLTVQDVIWLNHQVLQRGSPFRALELEEAVNHQYGYGGSGDLLGQAGLLLAGLLRIKPFEEGNQRTALLACASFLSLNGKALELTPDLAARVRQVGGGEDGVAMVKGLARDAAVEAIGVEEAARDAQAALQPALEALAPVASSG